MPPVWLAIAVSVGIVIFAALFTWAVSEFPFPPITGVLSR